MPRVSLNRSRLGSAVGLVLATSVPANADWPNFRGSLYDGISRETGIRTTWDGPIPLVWDRDIGSGFSSFACVGDRVFTAGTANGQQVLYCLNADTGNIDWQRAFEMEYSEPTGGDGPRATPTVADGRVYMLGALGKLICVDATDGAPIWEKQFHYVPQWGYSGSILVEGDLAIASGGESDGVLVAYDRKSGERVWKCGDDPVGYATPYPFTFNNQRYVVGFSGNSVIIAELKTGRQVWRMPWQTDWKVNAAAPIFHEGYLFLSSGYRTGCGLFKLSPKGSQLDVDEVWKSDVLMNKFQSCILDRGNLYSSDQKALVCVDFLTGREHWREHRIKHGTLVLAEGHLFLLTQDGKLQIAPASPEGFKPTTMAEVLSGRCWTVPVLHRGKLYARNLERVVCFNMKR